MNLIDDIGVLATIWQEAHGRSAARLATIVINDGKFFERLANGAGCTLSTYERFMAFFAEPSNWPEGSVPPSAGDVLSRRGALQGAVG